LTKRLLIVDDDKDIRSLLRDFLTDLGYNVTEASEGREALNLFRKERHNLVISDVRMPGMNGMDLLKWIKSISPKTPVLLITGYRPTKSQEEAMATKADGYLIKPFELERLRLIITQFVR
jgi:DNA-binding NtrC family response regulator